MVIEKRLLIAAFALALVAACARVPDSAPPQSNSATSEAPPPDIVITDNPPQPGNSAVALQETKKPKRFLGFLRGTGEVENKPEETNSEPLEKQDELTPELTPSEGESAPETDPQNLSLTDGEIAAPAPGADTPDVPSRRPRVFGFLQRRAPVESGPATVETVVKPAETTDTPNPQPSLTDEEIAATGNAETEAEPSRRPRVFGFLRNRTPGDADTDDATPASAKPTGTLDTALSEEFPEEDPPKPSPMALPDSVLPFGIVAKDCDVKKRVMGTNISRSASGQLKLFDPIPNSTAPRTQFITGFKDGCARRMTGALVLFGAHDVHEATRYARHNKTPWTDTDKAYENVTPKHPVR